MVETVYMDFLYGKDLPHTKASIDLDGIKNFINDFDMSLVDEFIELMNSYDKVFWLSRFPKPDDLKPYEKSRIVFFIFIEEVIQQIIFNNRQQDSEQNEINEVQEDIQDSYPF